MNEKEIKIMMEAGFTKSEAVDRLKNGTIVFEHDDFVNNFDDYMDEWNIEDREPLWHELKSMIETKDPAPEWHIVDYEGETYFIMVAG